MWQNLFRQHGRTTRAHREQRAWFERNTVKQTGDYKNDRGGGVGSGKRKKDKSVEAKMGGREGGGNAGMRSAGIV